MEVCANCEHPVPFHGGVLGCAADNSQTGSGRCGCTWYEERAQVGPMYLAAVAKPGDTIIVGFSRPVSDEEVGWLAESFRPVTDRGIEVAFADQVASIIVVKGGGDAVDGA